jgi:hypothetical protein
LRSAKCQHVFFKVLRSRREQPLATHPIIFLIAFCPYERKNTFFV